MNEDDSIAQQLDHNQQSIDMDYIGKTQNQHESLLGQHLDSEKIIEQLQYMLLSLEYNEKEQKYVPIKMFIGYNKDKEPVYETEAPLMNPKDIRITISFLRMHLNANTFLSKLSPDRINDIMWDVNLKLATTFYKLRHKIDSATWDMLWGMIEHPILFGLSRADNKNTLDAFTKTQHSVEHIKNESIAAQDKDFKMF